MTKLFVCHCSYALTLRRGEDVQVQAIFGLVAQVRQQALEIDEPSHGHPVQGVRLVGHIGQALRAHGPRGVGAPDAVPRRRRAGGPEAVGADRRRGVRHSQKRVDGAGRPARRTGRGRGVHGAHHSLELSVTGLHHPGERGSGRGGPQRGGGGDDDHDGGRHRHRGRAAVHRPRRRRSPCAAPVPAGGHKPRTRGRTDDAATGYETARVRRVRGRSGRRGKTTVAAVDRSFHPLTVRVTGGSS